MPDIRYGRAPNVGEPVPAQTVVVGEDVLARTVADLAEVRAALAAYETAARALLSGLEAHPVCIHGPEYDEAIWQNGCDFCPLVKPLVLLLEEAPDDQQRD